MKHKQLTYTILTAALLAALGIAIHAAEQTDIGLKNQPSGGAWLEDTPAITQYDLDTDFQDYAQDDSRVIFPQKGFALFPGTLPNGRAVGVVVDHITDTPIPNAAISVDGTALVTSDENGRFQIEHIPDGYYDWDVTADDYQPGHFKNYDVWKDDGASIFTFHLRKDREMVRDHLEYVQRPSADFLPPER